MTAKVNSIAQETNVKLLLIDTQNIYNEIRKIDPQLRFNYELFDKLYGPFKAKIAFVKGDILRYNAFADYLSKLRYQIVYRRNPLFDIDFAWYSAQVAYKGAILVIVSNNQRLTRLYQKFNAIQDYGLDFHYQVYGYNMPSDYGVELPGSLLQKYDKKSCSPTVT
jgi:hypothetical protein